MVFKTGADDGADGRTAEAAAATFLSFMLPTLSSKTAGNRWLELAARRRDAFVTRPILVTRDAYLDHLGDLVRQEGAPPTDAVMRTLGQARRTRRATMAISALVVPTDDTDKSVARRSAKVVSNPHDSRRQNEGDAPRAITTRPIAWQVPFQSGSRLNRAAPWGDRSTPGFTWALLVCRVVAMFQLMAFKKSKSVSKGSGTSRSASSGQFLSTKSMSRSAHSSFSLPNGERISTVRKDIMDRALNRTPGKER
ncbi:hypothetical protein ASE70_17460 [Sphingomonas sp. Leaf22]|uniref:hypothetical protein n=1 Tax=Sphingomonas sp. Leaf22 TaxID=1735687 RepID=UPI0006FC1E58|nr:hypothetical protein [Sphingomonas sp. Leaf22]KQM86688.1 hypothetical protein ASE70_17460 [Sphingomonas sp. Leaf22]